MFKKGDDLRQDILTLQLFKVMHSLWYEGGNKTKMTRTQNKGNGKTFLKMFTMCPQILLRHQERFGLCWCMFYPYADCLYRIIGF